MTSVKTQSRVDFDLRQLEIFCKVVELKSFSKAASAVHLAQASVSERINTLEKMVGVPLLDRLGRTIAPSKVGELLYKHALKHLEMKRQTCLEIEDFLGIRKGEIEIGGSTIPGEYILPGVMKRFRNHYPDITVQLHIGDSGDISSKVADGTVELGVVGSRAKIRGLVQEVLWKDELKLVVRSSHRWAKKKSISLQTLCREPFISRESGSGTRLILKQHLEKSGAAKLEALNVVSCLGSSQAVKEGVKQGLGVSILSLRAVESEVDAGILKIVPVKGLKITRHFYLIHDKRRSLSPLSRAFQDFLCQEAGTVSK